MPYLKLVAAAIALVVIVLARRASAPASLAGFHLSAAQRLRHRQLTQRARRMGDLRDLGALVAVLIGILPQ